jgi:uncharacterized protein YbjT (DUF2867 family)
MENPESLGPAFAGAYGVYSVQTPYVDGPQAEIRQGRNVAEAAKAAGVQHFVYGSAGTGTKGTGVPSWETKLVIQDHIQALGLPLTVLRPVAFMELMTDKKFYPAISTWNVMPALMGASRVVLWLSTEDLGAIVVQVFARPDEFTGQDIHLASDRQTIDQCRGIYRKVTGKNPPRIPLPALLFARFGFVGKDLSIMWRWLRTSPFDLDVSQTLSIHPGAMNVETWLRRQSL